MRPDIFARPLFRPAEFIAATFAVVIVLGTALLAMPWAVVGPRLDLLDALFTATSAVCVTGLIVVDTGSRFSPAGQTVILFLVQIGGLGIVTLSALTFYLITGRVSVRDRDALVGGVAGGRPRGLGAALKRILLLTLVAEAAGAVLLFLFFRGAHTTREAAGQAVFHAVSAFCNAGFSLYPDSLVRYAAHAGVNAVVMLLIVTGGIGFPVLLEVLRAVRRRARRVRLSLHTRLVLITTGCLLLGGTALFYAVEHANTLSDRPVADSLMAAAFQSVTARTAGFNTVDISHLANTTLFVLILLMFVGGASGSCAGGIKVNSLGVLVTLALGRLRGRSDVSLLGRRVPEPTVDRVIAVTALSFLFQAGILMLLLLTELGDTPHPDSRGTFLELAFETSSAFGTVGLSTGGTPSLTGIGKLLVIGLMFVGRIGPLTVSSVLSGRRRSALTYPEEDVLVG